MVARPQGQLSIVLLPSGDAGQEVLEVARSWAAEGLLKRGLWVPSDGLQPSPHGGALVPGILLDHAQEQQLDVATVLANVRVESLMMVVLQMVTDDQPYDRVLSGAARALSEAIRNARPESLRADADRDPVGFEVLNLLASPTGTAGIQFGQVAALPYASTVVAAPEDRRAAEQMDQFVRPGGNYVPWATAQACTLAGLWSGMTQTPWDANPTGVDGSSSLAQGDFSLPMRSFARVVTSAPTARRALALAMDETRFAPGNLLADDKILQVADPQAVIAQTLEALDGIDDGRLRYETPAAGTAPGQRKTAFLTALGEFTKFSAREIFGIPRFVVQRFSARVSNRTTRALSGEDGHEQITVMGHGPDLSLYEMQFERQAIEAERQVNAVVPGVLPSAPELWRTLGQTSLALLDGSPLPAAIPTPIVAEKRVVLPSAMLSVPPPAGWEPETEDSEALRDLDLRNLFVAPCGTRQAGQVNQLLADKSAEQRNLMEEAQQRLLKATVALAVLEADDDAVIEEAVLAEDDVDDGVEDAGEEAAEDEETLEEEEVAAEQASPGRSAVDLRVEIAAATIDIEAVDRRLSAVTRLEDTFTEWLAQRENSLFWRLTKRVEERTRQAKSDSESFHAAAVEVPHIDADEPRRARNQFANRFLLFLPVTLLLIYLAARLAGPLERNVSIPQWLTWLVVAIIAVAWLLIILTSYYRRISRFRKRVEDLVFAQRDALRRFHLSIEAHHRLNGMYEQLIEWGEILGFAIHDPWRPEEQWFSGTVSGDFRANLPACVDLAVPDPDDEEGTRLLQRTATRSITGGGWRTATFHQLHGILLKNGGYDPQDLSAAAMLFDDAPAMPNGARKAMLEQLRTGALQKQCARQVLEAKVARLYDERDTLMRHTVLPINSEYAAEETGLLDEDEGLRKLRPTWGDYLTSTLVGATRFGMTLWSAKGRTDNGARSSMRTLRFAPPGLHLDDTMPGEVISLTLSADKNRGVEVVVRCDFGPHIEKEALLIFSGESLVDEADEPPTSIPQVKRQPGRSGTEFVADVKMFN